MNRRKNLPTMRRRMTANENRNRIQRIVAHNGGLLFFWACCESVCNRTLFCTYYSHVVVAVGNFAAAGTAYAVVSDSHCVVRKCNGTVCGAAHQNTNAADPKVILSADQLFAAAGDDADALPRRRFGVETAALDPEEEDTVSIGCGKHTVRHSGQPAVNRYGGGHSRGAGCNRVRLSRVSDSI